MLFFSTVGKQTLFCTEIAAEHVVCTAVTITAAFPIWIWHQIISSIIHPCNLLIILLVLVPESTAVNPRARTDTHRQRTRLRRQDIQSFLETLQRAEIENAVIMLFMKLASRGKKNTIEELSTLEIRINTNQAYMFWLQQMKPRVCFFYCVCGCLSVLGGRGFN